MSEETIIFILVFGVVFLVFGIGFWLWLKRIYGKKCPHYKVCKLYNPKHDVCSEKAGYFNPEYPASCCRKLNYKLKRIK